MYMHRKLDKWDKSRQTKEKYEIETVILIDINKSFIWLSNVTWWRAIQTCVARTKFDIYDLLS